MAQTAKSILGQVLENGSFLSTEQNRILKTIPQCDKFLTHIPTYMFGEYLIKCTGNLNSILKEGKPLEDCSYQPVVKNKIGYKHVSRSSGKGYGNSRYINMANAYSILHPSHIPLVCKKTKREVVQDFWNLKEDFISRFHNLKDNLPQFIDSQILISDVSDIGYKNPSSRFGPYLDIGHVVMNPRLIQKDKVSFTMIDLSKAFLSYKEQMLSGNIIASKTHSVNGKIQVSCMVEDCDPFTNNLKTIKLFDLIINGKYGSYSNNPSLSLHNSKFDGIDIAGINNYLIKEYSSFYQDFVDRLTELRDKNLAEFTLNEICDEESETAI